MPYPKRLRAHQCVPLSRSKVEDVGDPYKEVSRYLTALTRQDALKESRVVAVRYADSETFMLCLPRMFVGVS